MMRYQLEKELRNNPVTLTDEVVKNMLQTTVEELKSGLDSK